MPTSDVPEPHPSGQGTGGDVPAAEYVGSAADAIESWAEIDLAVDGSAGDGVMTPDDVAQSDPPFDGIG